MEQSRTWVEALNISSENVNQWSSQAPPGKPLLVWCIEEGLVPASEYLLWASEHFGLPVLSSAFFEAGGLDPKFAYMHRQSGTWTPWCFPVDEWDGVIYVACAEPPQERRREICYVLADPRAMAEAWELTSSEAASNSSVLGSEPPPLEDGPAGLALGAAKSFQLNIDEGNLLALNNEGQLHHPETPKVETPTGPNLAIEGGGDMQVPEYDVNPMIDETAALPEPEEGGKIESSLHTLPDLVQAANRFRQPIKPVELPANESAALQTAFSHINRVYSNSCVLRCSPSDAILYTADKSLHAKPDLHIDLAFPSFLRIVSRTGLPYHGHLIDTPNHREFFQALGLKELPGCATAVPLRINGKTWGILLAVGPEKLQSLENLAVVEATAEQLLKTFGTIWAQSAA